jgi:hypothetical protein
MGCMYEAKQLRALKSSWFPIYKARASAHRAVPQLAIREKLLIILKECAIQTGIFCVGAVHGGDTLLSE